MSSIPEFGLLHCLYKNQTHRIRMMQYHQRRSHRYWVHDTLQRRLEHGAFYHLVKELEINSEKQHEYFRMSAEKLEYVLTFVGPTIQKRTVSREPLQPKQKLAICIRFLTTGESYTSLATQYRVGVTSVSRLVSEVCTAIWHTMAGMFLKIPQTAQEWRVVAMDFRQKWDFPHCVGAIDGKHIVIKSPINSGSLYYNYKGTFSIVLMALVDASNRFLCVAIGAYDRQSDAGVFANTELGKSLNPPNRLNLPPAEIIEGAEHIGPMPYVVVGDEAFPQQQHVMRPYPGKQCTMDHHAYNYRHSRTRRIVECAFGILATGWRVFYTKMAIYPENVEVVVQGAVILHNMLQTETTPGTNVEDLLQEQR